MASDYNLDRKAAFSAESEFKSLYTWSLYETDQNGQKLGRNLIPWQWSLYFTATEISLHESLSLEEEHDGPIRKEERQQIIAKVLPSRHNDVGKGESYSMFGTSRHISSFGLTIYPLDDDTKEEFCRAWGSVSYNVEVDFRNETSEDTVQFFLALKRERFARYLEMVRNYPADSLVLRVGNVHGFYSDWSPSITTNNVKVLVGLEEQGLVLPEGCTIAPPTLTRVGEFEIRFLTKRFCDRPIRALDADETGTDTFPPLTPAGETLVLQRASSERSARIERMLGQLLYAAWAAVVLLVLLLLHWHW